MVASETTEEDKRSFLVKYLGESVDKIIKEKDGCTLVFVEEDASYLLAICILEKDIPCDTRAVPRIADKGKVLDTEAHAKYKSDFDTEGNMDVDRVSVDKNVGVTLNRVPLVLSLVLGDTVSSLTNEGSIEGTEFLELAITYDGNGDGDFEGIFKGSGKKWNESMK